VADKAVADASCGRLDQRRRLIGRSSLFRDLADELIDHVARHARERSLADGEPLFFKNDPGDFMAIVVTGRIYNILHGPDGQELIVDTMQAGDPVGETALLTHGRRDLREPDLREHDLRERDLRKCDLGERDLRRRDFTAVASGPTRVLVLARRHFDLLMSDPALLERAYAVLRLRLCRVIESLENMCLHRLESRLARYLLSSMRDEGTHPGHGFEVVLPPTQRILAAMLNVSRPKLNAQLQRWHRAGLVSRSRNVLRINDIDLFRYKARLGRETGRPIPRVPRVPRVGNA
jgi:CRP-like cAMP-binding protein